MNPQSEARDTSEPDDPALDLSHPLVIGFGITGQAVVRALLDRGIRPTVTDDGPSEIVLDRARALGLELVAAPEQARLAALVAEASILLPSPGVPDHHPVFAQAELLGLATASEFDLAQIWDIRPLIAITGTNGKTTVTMMVTEALERSGIRAAAVGNTDLPLVEAIDNPDIEVFVVEASSFRLGHSLSFRPAVAAWLNFSPDHLDAHSSLDSYEAAKAAIWAGHGERGTAIVNVADSVVSRHAPSCGSVQTFGSPSADWGVRDGFLAGPDGPIIEVSRLARRQPHDLANAAAAAATAMAAGASAEGVVEMLSNFSGLPHRMELVEEFDGVRWFNDSKATVPHATLAAVGGYDSVVLIAGGRNKGLDLSLLKAAVPPVKAVIAIGDAADDIVGVFEGLVPVEVGVDMDDAIDKAAEVATRGDVVILSPACTSFDWYSNYEERGSDFARRATRKLSR